MRNAAANSSRNQSALLIEGDGGSHHQAADGIHDADLTVNRSRTGDTDLNVAAARRFGCTRPRTC
jgi:hypothetical protein